MEKSKRAKVQMSENVGKYIEFMTWKEVEQSLSSANVIVLPVGARTKEHGFHLQLNNDWLLAEYFTKRVVEKCNVLVLPTLQYGYYPAFVEYAGSVNIQKETCTNTVVDICKSLHSQKQGLRFYVLNTGISTNYALEPARAKLLTEGIVMEYTNVSKAEDECGLKPTQIWGSHADEMETSMMLYIAPHTVRMELAEKDVEPYKKGGFTKDINNKAKMYVRTGAWGDPTLATVEKGKTIVEGVVTYHLRQIEELQRPDYVPSPIIECYLTH